MSTIQSLIIPCVDYSYTQEYVANAFWKQRIARVSSVTLIPYIRGEWIYYIAYINVDRWCDSENAYNFISNLNNPSKETRLVHYEDNWWSVEKSVNTFALKDATVLFEPSYYERFIEDAKDAVEEDNYPIQGLHSTPYYTDIEAEEWHINTLKELETDVEDEDDKCCFRAEIEQLQSSLKMFNRSNNVTETYA